MTRLPPPWMPPPPSATIDILSFGTTLGQILAHHTQAIEAHHQSIAVQEDMLSELRGLPARIATELERSSRRRSLWSRLKYVWPWLTGLGYVIAVASGRLGAGDALMKFLAAM